MNKKNNDTTDVLLNVKNLKVHFPVSSRSIFNKKRNVIKAVDGISFSVKKGETFGLVGESGCGKSTTARTIVRLNNPSAGNIEFEHKDIAHARGQELLHMRRDVQMIFQDPYASLNPRMTVGSLISEPLRILRHYKILSLSNAEIEARVDRLLEQVGLKPSMKKRFPHEFSGGQRQRIGIARSIVTYPKLVIADEPISALDVSVQAQIINLMNSLQKEFGLTYIFIAHDLTVVNYISDRIAVMYLGSIVESAPANILNKNPLHPYTRMLWDAILVPHPDSTRSLAHANVKGEAYETSVTSGCPFYDRCPLRMERCKTQNPPLKALDKHHHVACWLY